MKKHPDLLFHTIDPVNAEAPLQLLRKNFITPQELFYVRNHGKIPEIDSKAYRLRVNGLVEQELLIPMDEIMKDFQRATVVATVQCAGNRRTELLSVAPIPGEVPWKEGAIGNATWSGAPLMEVLKKAGIKSDALFAEFMGTDDVFRNGKNVGFGASIPIEKALSADVLLAYMMNGEILEPTHGFPLRVIVPGYIGARSVKWVSQITLRKDPSKNYFQDHAYRLFQPQDRPETVDWNSGVQLNQLSVNCAITSPANGDVMNDETFTVQGYASSGSGKKIARVELSSDEGLTWTDVNIVDRGNAWSWVFWEATIRLPTGHHELAARAFSEDAESQPKQLDQVWNFKGYMNNAWHRIKIEV